MLEIILDEKKEYQAVKEVRWNGEVLPHVEGVDISFRGGNYPCVWVQMQAITVKIGGAKMLAEVQFTDA